MSLTVLAGQAEENWFHAYIQIPYPFSTRWFLPPSFLSSPGQCPGSNAPFMTLVLLNDSGQLWTLKSVDPKIFPRLLGPCQLEISSPLTSGVQKWDFRPRRGFPQISIPDIMNKYILQLSDNTSELFVTLSSYQNESQLFQSLDNKVWNTYSFAHG